MRLKGIGFGLAFSVPLWFLIFVVLMLPLSVGVMVLATLVLVTGIAGVWLDG